MSAGAAASLADRCCRRWPAADAIAVLQALPAERRRACRAQLLVQLLQELQTRHEQSQGVAPARAATPSAARAEAILSFLEPHLLLERAGSGGGGGSQPSDSWSWSECVQRWAGWPAARRSGEQEPAGSSRSVQEDRSAALWHRFIGRAAPPDKPPEDEAAESTEPAAGDTTDRCELLKRDLIRSLTGLGDMLRRDNSSCSFYSLESDSLQERSSELSEEPSTGEPSADRLQSETEPELEPEPELELDPPQEAALSAELDFALSPELEPDLSEEYARREAQAMMAAGVGRQSSSESEPGGSGVEGGGGGPSVRRCNSVDSCSTAPPPVRQRSAESHPLHLTLEARCSFASEAERRLQLVVAARASCSERTSSSGRLASDSGGGWRGRGPDLGLSSSSSDSDGSDGAQITARRADQSRPITNSQPTCPVTNGIFERGTTNRSDVTMMSFTTHSQQRSFKMNVENTFCSISELSLDTTEEWHYACSNDIYKEQLKREVECLPDSGNTTLETRSDREVGGAVQLVGGDSVTLPLHKPTGAEARPSQSQSMPDSQRHPSSVSEPRARPQLSNLTTFRDQSESMPVISTVFGGTAPVKSSDMGPLKSSDVASTLPVKSDDAGGATPVISGDVGSGAHAGAARGGGAGGRPEEAGGMEVRSAPSVGDIDPSSAVGSVRPVECAGGTVPGRQQQQCSAAVVHAGGASPATADGAQCTVNSSERAVGAEGGGGGVERAWDIIGSPDDQEKAAAMNAALKPPVFQFHVSKVPQKLPSQWTFDKSDVRLVSSERTMDVSGESTGRPGTWYVPPVAREPSTSVSDEGLSLEEMLSDGVDSSVLVADDDDEPCDALSTPSTGRTAAAGAAAVREPSCSPVSGGGTARGASSVSPSRIPRRCRAVRQPPSPSRLPVLTAAAPATRPSPETARRTAAPQLPRPLRPPLHGTPRCPTPSKPTVASVLRGQAVRLGLGAGAGRSRSVSRVPRAPPAGLGRYLSIHAGVLPTTGRTSSGTGYGGVDQTDRAARAPSKHTDYGFTAADAYSESSDEDPNGITLSNTTRSKLKLLTKRNEMRKGLERSHHAQETAAPVAAAAHEPARSRKFRAPEKELHNGSGGSHGSGGSGESRLVAARRGSQLTVPAANGPTLSSPRRSQPAEVAPPRRAISHERTTHLSRAGHHPHVSSPEKPSHILPSPGVQRKSGSMQNLATHKPPKQPPLPKSKTFGAELNKSSVPNSASSVFGEQLERFANPRQALDEAYRKLDSDDWEKEVSGLTDLVRLFRHHPDTVNADMKAVMAAVVKQMKNLRSQVLRAAIQTSAEMFRHCGRTAEPNLETIVAILLQKTSDTNKFIKADSNRSLDQMLEHVSVARAIVAITTEGLGHRSSQVRATVARLLAAAVTRLGVAASLSGQKDITDRLVPAAAQLVREGDLQTRINAKEIFQQWLQYPDLDKVLNKYLNATVKRDVDKVLDNIRNEGSKKKASAPGKRGFGSKVRLNRTM